MVGVLTDVVVDPHCGGPCLRLDRYHRHVVCPCRYLCRARRERHVEAEVAVEGGHSLHEGVTSGKRAQRAVGEDVEGVAVERRVPAEDPASSQPVWTMDPVEIELYYHAFRVGIVCQHVAHGYGVRVSVVGEGYDHVVRLQLCEGRSARARVE